MTAVVLPPALRRAVSSYTGIVRSLEECLHPPSEPPLFRYTAEAARGTALLGASLDHLVGVGGAGMTRGEAAAAAVGEAVERYSGTFVPSERLVVATADELGDVAVAPERFALFSAAQYASAGFPFAPFTRETRVAWIDGWSVADDRRVLVPAELVFLAQPVPAGCARIGYATSSGMACAETIDEALVRGLAEVLERDAFMIAWANRLSLPLLDWSDDDGLRAIEARTFGRTGLPYAAVDLSCFHGLPSVLGVVRSGRRAAGALGVGAGTAATVERAWWKALSEAFACRAAGAKLALLRPESRYGAQGEGVFAFEDHIQYYADPDRAAAAAFLDASPARTPVGRVPPLRGESPSEHVSALCEAVARAGSDAYVVDVTAPDVRELGLVVTKVVAPELCPLEVPQAARFLGGRRLYEAAAALGLRAGRLREEDVNPEPHPFP
jgi:ribosomal protein S12 methylthiotransferase accessory factor